jgi:hypothetical protein
VPSIRIEDDGAHRHLQDEILTASARAVLGAALRALAGSELRVARQVLQAREPRVRLEDDGTAIAPIAAVRAALGHVFLAPEGHAALATVSGVNANLDFVYEQDSAPGCLAQAREKARKEKARKKESGRGAPSLSFVPSPNLGAQFPGS